MKIRTKYCIYFRNDGIGARTKGLYAMFNVAIKYKLPVFIIWDIDPHPQKLGCPFEILYDSQHYDYVNVPYPGCNPPTLRNVMQQLRDQTIIPHLQDSKRITPPVCINTLLNMFFQDSTAINFTDLEHKRSYTVTDSHLMKYDILIFGRKITTPLNYKVRNHTHHNQLIIHPSIIHDVNQFLTDRKLNEPIVCHVRRGDISTTARAFPLKCFFDVIDKLPKKLPIIVCTENFSVISEFQKKYSDRQVENYPVTSFGRQNTEQIRNAMIDFVLISKAKHAVIDGVSHFCLSAVCYGNVQNVHVKST